MAATIRAIIFDFGNVIAFFDHRRAARRFAPLSRMPEHEMLPAIYDTALEHDFESGRITAEEFNRRAVELIGFRGTKEEFAAGFVDIFSPNPAVIDLIPRLSRFRLVLGSNTNALHAAHFRKQFGELLGRFHGLGLSYEAGARKPSAEFYRHCVQIAGVPASECLFIDDMAGNVQGARTAGLTAIHFTPGTDLQTEFATLGIEFDKLP